MNFASCFFSISKASIHRMYRTIGGISIPANAIGWRWQPGYFILNISRIICEDLQTDSLANLPCFQNNFRRNHFRINWLCFPYMGLISGNESRGETYFFENSFVQSWLNRNLKKLLQKIFLPFKGLNWNWGFSRWYIS